ncbi:MAG: helix-turn-helix transcriptional regulator [Clostridia bacterium]|nr:helix-turn-helix transcriptional regulator [Clostridia bacterium]
MIKPFILIECKKGYRNEFKITEGVQPTYALLYLIDGSYRLSIDDRQTILRSGDCAIFSDDVDFYRSVISPITFIILQFQPNPNCPFSVPIPLGKVEFKNKQRFQDSIEKYAALMDAHDVRAVYYKEHLLEDILLQAFAENEGESLLRIGEHPDKTHDATVLRAIGFIRDNIDKKLSLEEICHATCTNTSTLNFKFRKELSTSIWGFVSAERMKKARFLLANTTHSISEIAKRCGFESIYYFSAAFRKSHKLSPGEYREQYR